MQTHTYTQTHTHTHTHKQGRKKGFKRGFFPFLLTKHYFSSGGGGGGGGVQFEPLVLPQVENFHLQKHDSKNTRNFSLPQFFTLILLPFSPSLSFSLSLSLSLSLSNLQQQRVKANRTK